MQVVPHGSKCRQHNLAFPCTFLLEPSAFAMFVYCQMYNVSVQKRNAHHFHDIKRLADKYLNHQQPCKHDAFGKKPGKQRRRMAHLSDAPSRAGCEVFYDLGGHGTGQTRNFDSMMTTDKNNNDLLQICANNGAEFDNA